MFRNLPLSLLVAITLASCGLETRTNPNYHAPKDAGMGGAGKGGKAGSGGRSAGDGGSSGTGGADAGRVGTDGGAAGMNGRGGRDATAGGAGGARGGDGGQAGMDAGPCGLCSDATPVCDETTGLCVECELKDDCKDTSRPACDSTAHRCVQCVEQSDCGGSTAVCDTGAQACVQCLAKADCSGDTPLCDQSAQTCVECLQPSDCGDPLKARCDAEVCTVCDSDAQCTRLTATPVCDEGRGACVECTADTEATRCGTKACNRATGTCTTVDRGTATPCTPCEADSECVTGARCVHHRFGTQDLGTYCFYDEAANNGCADANHPSLRPYSQPMTLTSIDGAAATYCLPPTSTTCKGIEDATARGASGGKVCAMSGDCGEPDLSDGICGDGGATLGKCTYTCQHAYDCPQNGFTTCATVGTARCE